jgi:hypothetical protein
MRGSIWEPVQQLYPKERGSHQGIMRDIPFCNVKGALGCQNARNLHKGVAFRLITEVMKKQTANHFIEGGVCTRQLSGQRVQESD